MITVIYNRLAVLTDDPYITSFLNTQFIYNKEKQCTIDQYTFLLIAIQSLVFLVNLDPITKLRNKESSSLGACTH